MLNAGIYAYIAGDVSGPGDFFASVYAIFFGLLLMAYELRIQRFAVSVNFSVNFLATPVTHCEKPQVQHYFGFMYKAWGRCMFLLFIGTVPLGGSFSFKFNSLVIQF